MAADHFLRLPSLGSGFLALRRGRIALPGEGKGFYVRCTRCPGHHVPADWFAVLCLCSASLATISFSSNTLTYSSPSDLGTTIDPSGQKDVTNSYGITKASFQALSPKVVAFNGAPAATQTLRTLVVNYTASSTVTFTFPTAMYNYGSMTTCGRGSFSGSAAQDAISTVPVQNGSLYDWFDATITSTGGQGVQSLGFCAAFRNDQAVSAGPGAVHPVRRHHRHRHPAGPGRFGQSRVRLHRLHGPHRQDDHPRPGLAAPAGPAAGTCRSTTCRS